MELVGGEGGLDKSEKTKTKTKNKVSITTYNKTIGFCQAHAQANSFHITNQHTQIKMKFCSVRFWGEEKIRVSRKKSFVFKTSVPKLCLKSFLKVLDSFSKKALNTSKLDSSLTPPNFQELRMEDQASRDFALTLGQYCTLRRALWWGDGNQRYTYSCNAQSQAIQS